MKKGSDLVPINNPDSLSPEEIQYLNEDRKQLQDIVAGVCPDIDPPTHARVAHLLHLVSQGMIHRKACAKSKCTFGEFSLIVSKSEVLGKIYSAAKERGDQVRQESREEELDKRGKKGWLEPVYQGGKKVGSIRRFSDKCLEIAVKGGDKTGKFADRQKIENTGNVIHYHIEGVPERGSTPPEKRIDADVTVKPPDGTTNG